MRPGPASSCNSHFGQVQSDEYKLRVLSWDNLHSRLQKALRSTQKGAEKKNLTSLVRDSAVEATEELGRAPILRPKEFLHGIFYSHARQPFRTELGLRINLKC